METLEMPIVMLVVKILLKFSFKNFVKKTSGLKYGTMYMYVKQAISNNLLPT